MMGGIQSALDKFNLSWKDLIQVDNSCKSENKQSPLNGFDRVVADFLFPTHSSTYRTFQALDYTRPVRQMVVNYFIQRKVPCKLAKHLISKINLRIWWSFTIISKKISNYEISSFLAYFDGG